jgi:small multidrug resistance pump
VGLHFGQGSSQTSRLLKQSLNGYHHHSTQRELSVNNWLYLAAAIIGEVIATSTLKSSEGFTRVAPSVVVVLGYGVSFYFMSLALKTIPVGIVYAIWAGVGIVLVAVIAWLMHGQKLDLWALVGIGLIVAGVAVINLLSKSAAH